MKGTMSNIRSTFARQQSEGNTAHNEANQSKPTGVRVSREGPQTGIISVLQRFNQLSRHGVHTKDPNQTSRDENHNAWDEKHTDEINGTLESAEKTICELEGIAIEYAKWNTQKKKDF